MPVLVNHKSKLSKALRLHPDVLEYIVSLSPHEFVRLRNPLMRQLMPGRISLARIAKMTGMNVIDLLENIHLVAGQPLTDADRHELQQHVRKSDDVSGYVDSTIKPPTWIDVDALVLVNLLEHDAHLDADPIVPINIAIKGNPPGTVILIKHMWEPQPLYDVWDKIDIEHHAVQVGEDEWWIYVRKNASCSEH